MNKYDIKSYTGGKNGEKPSVKEHLRPGKCAGLNSIGFVATVAANGSCGCNNYYC